MTEIPPEALAIAATVTGHTVGCMCQRCDDIRGERTHPGGDYRPMVARLIAEVERLNRVRDSLVRRLGVRWGELEEARAALAQITDERAQAAADPPPRIVLQQIAAYASERAQRGQAEHLRAALESIAKIASADAQLAEGSGDRTEGTTA